MSDASQGTFVVIPEISPIDISYIIKYENNSQIVTILLYRRPKKCQGVKLPETQDIAEKIPDESCTAFLRVCKNLPGRIAFL